MNKNYLSLDKALLFFLALGFGLPFSLSSTLPLSTLDVIMLMAFIAIAGFGKLRIPREFLWLALAFLISLTVITVNLFIDDGSLRAFASLVYFYKPYIAYLIGFSLIKDVHSLHKFAKLIFQIFSVLVCLCVLLGDQTSRGNLEILGFSIFGSDGTNALMVYFAFLLLLSQVVRGDYSLSGRISFVTFTILALAIVLESSSRQALLGIIFFYMLYFGRSNVKQLIIFGIIFLFLFYFLLPDVLIVKANRDFLALTDGDIDSFSAGRTLLYITMASDLFNNPFFGNSFSGFSESSLPEGFEYAVGLSPHNQYLGALWKMGGIPFLFYIIFLFSSIAYVWRLERGPYPFGRGATLLVFIVAVVFMNTQDFLTFGLTGNIFMIAIGAFQRIYKSQALGFLNKY